MFIFPHIPEGVFTKAPEKIVSCVEFQGYLIVATEHRLFRLVGDELVPIKFVNEAKDQP